MLNSYYKDSIANFVAEPEESILGKLAIPGGNEPNQMKAWIFEIQLMKSIMAPYQNEDAGILFEYSIPRFSRRVDVLLLLRGIVFCLEFKVGQEQYLVADVDQTLDYALDLKNFRPVQMKID